MTDAVEEVDAWTELRRANPIAMGPALTELMEQLPCVQQAEDFHSERLRQAIYDTEIKWVELRCCEARLAELRGLTRKQRVLAFLDASDEEVQRLVTRMPRKGLTNRVWRWMHWLNRARV